MGFERYTDFVLDVPMYFVVRDGNYIDAGGLSFRDSLAGQLPVLPGDRPAIRDWENRLTTVFAQVRLESCLELRGADAGVSVARVLALAALWAVLARCRPASPRNTRLERKTQELPVHSLQTE